jgi:hypothetical protein
VSSKWSLLLVTLAFLPKNAAKCQYFNSSMNKGDHFMITKCYYSVHISLIVACFCATSAFADLKVFRVDRTNGTTTGDGSDWGEDAYKYLQNALTDAATWVAIPNSGNIAQIWVAAGTHKPDEIAASPNGSGSRSASFHLLENVKIYGGFEGDEVGTNAFLQRDPATNITILSGDLDGDDEIGLDVLGGLTFDNYDENSYHVVFANEVNSRVPHIIAQRDVWRRSLISAHSTLAGCCVAPCKMARLCAQDGSALH